MAQDAREISKYRTRQGYHTGNQAYARTATKMMRFCNRGGKNFPLVITQNNRN